MADGDYKRLSFSGCYKKKSVELACLIAFFFSALMDMICLQEGEDMLIKIELTQTRCFMKKRSTFKFFCGQDVGYISHVGFT